MNSLKFNIIVFFFLIAKVGWAQNPAHIVLGAKELANTQIYAVHETQNQEIYISTDNGIFYYENDQFINIPAHPKQKRISLFNLVENKKGELFCNNLNGQVFKIENKKLKLHYSLPSEKLYDFPYLMFDNQEALLISGKGLYNITNPKKVVEYLKESVSTLTKLIDGRIVMRLEYGFLKTLDKGKISSIECDSSELNIAAITLLEDKIIGYFKKEGFKVLSPSAKHINSKVSLSKARVLQFSKNRLWSLGNSSGIKELRYHNEELKEAGNYFKHQFISAITKTKNGSLLLGTFGNGVIVIPNLNVKSNLLSHTKTVRSIAVTPRNRVYYADNGKGVLSFEKNKTEQVKKAIGQLNYSKIFTVEKINFKNDKAHPNLFLGDVQLDKQKAPFGAIKDICIIDSTGVLIASSTGLSKIGEAEVFNKLSWKSDENWGVYQSCPKIKQRIKALAYDKYTQEIYLATPNKLLKLKSNNTLEEVLYKGESLQVNALQFNKSYVWVATAKYGVLIYEKGIFKTKIAKKEGLNNLRITKLQVLNDKVYILTADGLQYFNLESKKLVSLSKNEGFLGFINDFNFSSDTLWMLVDNQRLNKIAIKNIPKENKAVKLTIDSIKIGSNLLLTKKQNNFAYKQNKLAVYATVKNVIQRLHTKLYYKVSGVDTSWNIKNATDKNPIVYRSLPPGDYTLSMYTSYGTTKGEVKNYNFSVKAPYWQQWWFYLGGIILVIGIAYYIFNKRLEALKKKETEKLEKQALQTDLLQTQLTALRSQMNPHFIFNALNSIQDLVLRQDTDTSYDYIVLFSKLVRSTLNYSSKDFIDLTAEIEFLEVYLKLEKLRFGEEFSYSITSDVKEALETPSLLIQPFVENALVHGLLHKEGEKDIVIHFEFTDELICTITDNGIGRVQMQEIHKRQGKSNTSFALGAIKKRLQIFSKQNHKKVGYTIFDLYENKNAIGTKVVVSLPYKIKT